MSVYKRTNDNQGEKVINTGGDFNKATGVVKDRLHIVTSAEETSKLISTNFRFNVGLNELEVYVNGQLLGAKETINGFGYGDYSIMIERTLGDLLK